LLVLERAPENAQIIAGGTDLLLDMQQGRHEPVHTLVDVNDIRDMTALEIRGGELFIGASVPHRVITSSDLVQNHCQALATASGLIGGPQVRNTATIGGNVAHALPAADGTIALVSLDAEAEVVSRSGERRLPLVDLFLGPGESALKPRDELLTGFYVRLRKAAQASAFNRIMRPQGVAIAILNLAVWLHRTDEIIEDVRIAVGPSGPVPRRMLEAENLLRGNPLTGKGIALAHEAILGEAVLRTSRHRATEEYRRRMVGVLLENTLREAFDRSAGRV
jgi:carbon-monoxide dehydrogenase medium subunit